MRLPAIDPIAIMNAFKKLPCTLVFVVISLCTFCRPGLIFAADLTSAEEQYLKEKGGLVFVSQTQYPPFEFVGPDGDHTGMCIELVR